MPRNSKIPFCNRNQTDWWVFDEVLYWVPTPKKKPIIKIRHPVWVNTRLIRAKTREGAYQKAMKLGKASSSATFGGKWRFAGISSLLPVYEKLEDGAEIFWEKRGRMTVEKIRRLVKSKSKLPVFNDRADR